MRPAILPAATPATASPPAATTRTSNVARRPSAEPPMLRSIGETAAIFRRTPRTIRQWIADGHLRVIRVGRAVFISQDEINKTIGLSVEASEMQ